MSNFEELTVDAELGVGTIIELYLSASALRGLSGILAAGSKTQCRENFRRAQRAERVLHENTSSEEFRAIRYEAHQRYEGLILAVNGIT